jgi:hypothetical protein
VNNIAARLIAISVVLLAVGLFSIAHARRALAQVSAAATIDHRPDIQLARVVNTAEIRYRGQYGHFGTWDDLYDSGVIGLVARQLRINIAKGPEVLPDTTLALVISPGEDNYSVAIHDKADGHGLYSVFSDPSGIIYQGEALH